MSNSKTHLQPEILQKALNSRELEKKPTFCKSTWGKSVSGLEEGFTPGFFKNPEARSCRNEAGNNEQLSEEKNLSSELSC